MPALAPALDGLSLDITQEIHVRSSLEATFKALLEEMGPANQGQNATPMPMILEAWPGGRWFRDLDGGAGHLWGFVQAIKPPTLLELFGPMFMSSPVAGHMIIRLSPITGGTKLVFQNQVFGPLPAEMRGEGMAQGWDDMLKRLRKDVER